MTEGTYRKKALPHLMEDFKGHCAYCLDPSELRHSNQSHVDHFDSSLKKRGGRHRYANLMLACSTCNLCKHDKPVINKFDPKQRLLNCTLENEFSRHIIENEHGEWKPQTPEGIYHVRSIGLDEPCHNKKRKMRRALAKSILDLYSTAIQYTAHNPMELHQKIMAQTKALVEQLGNLPPLVTEQGVVSVRDWLAAQNVKFDDSYLP